VCTFILAWQLFADVPILVAANRDEATGRPSSPPALREEPVQYVGPRDQEAGGTWIGITEAGMLAALTNRWSDTSPEGERSRGHLVTDALARESAEAAVRAVEADLETTAYDGFNLVVVDETAALLCEWSGKLRIRQFEPGVHIVVNVGADDEFEIPARREAVGRAQAERTRRARSELQAAAGESAADWHARARSVLRDHDYGFCVHGDGYATRSSSLIARGRDSWRYDFADGAPCETGYRPVEWRWNP